MEEITCIGLDVHARSIRAAVFDRTTGEIIETKVDSDDASVVAFVLDVARTHAGVQVVYEAGPTGFHLARSLDAAGITCRVAAPSKLPRPTGERVKTDKRDALFLAKVGVMGEFAEVRVPTVAEEAARDLVRGRDDVRRELMAARHRLSKLCLRHGFVHEGRNWSADHERWLASIRREGLDGSGIGTLAAFDDAWANVETCLERRKRLDALIAQEAVDGPFTDATNRLACLRGISVLTAFGLAVEIGDFGRFTPTSIGSYLGLTPSESSSGQSRSQGGITKTGNSHARRLLVEAAWHHAPLYRPGKTMHERWAKAPQAVVTHADKGNRRLHDKYTRMTANKKHHTVIIAAIARETAGWCQVLATMDA